MTRTPSLDSSYSSLKTLTFSQSAKDASLPWFTYVLDFPNLTHENIDDKYDITSTILGHGSTCVVKLCIDKKTKKKYAVKIIDKDKISSSSLQSLRAEQKALLTLRKETKYIISLIDTFENHKYLFFVLELCRGQHLLHFVDSYKINETHVKYIFYQIVKAVHKCHKYGIIHRDIKLENILLLKNNALNIKLTDFGLAFNNNIDKNKKMTTKCGTIKTIAPEILVNQSYTSKIDWWACGVVLYVLLSGKYPFEHSNQQKLKELIFEGKYNFYDKVWNNISFNATDLIKNLLEIDPNKRYGFVQIMKHPWMELKN